MARSLKQSLLQSYITVSILPILIISAIVLYTLTVERRKEVGEKNLLVARAVSGQVKAFLREPQAMLSSVAGLLNTRPASDGESFQSLLDSVVNSSHMFESIYVLDRSGQVLSVGLSEEKASIRQDYVGLNLSHFPFFKQVVKTGEPTWSATFLSVISGHMSLALAMKVDGHILVGNFSIRHLVSFVRQLEAGKGIIISVVDHDGAIIAHPDPVLAASEVYVGHQLPVKKAMAGQEGVYRYRDGGREFLGSAVYIHGPEWVALISQDVDEAFGSVYRTGALFAVGMLGAVLFSILFSISNARRICAPLLLLINKAKAIAAGEYSFTPIPADTAEVTQLGISLGEMAEAIQGREEKILEGREEYRRLVDTMNDGLTVLNPNGVITYANPQFAEMIGYGVQYILGKPVTEFLDEKNRSIIEIQLERRKRGEAKHYELEWIKSDGSALYSLMSPQPIYKDGIFLGSFAVVTDISQRKEAEESVRQSLIEAEDARDKVDAIFRSVPHALVVTDDSGKIVMLNRNAEEVFGKSIYTLLYYPLQTVITDERFKLLFVSILEEQVASHAVDIEMFCHIYQEVRSFEVSCSIISSKDSIEGGVVVVLEDVTKIRESDRLKSEFIAIAAHELSTPLTSVLGYTELLLDEKQNFPPEQRREFMETIYSKGELLNRLVEDLLYLSRFESGREVLLDRAECHIEEILRGIVNSYRMEKPEWTFELSLAEEENLLYMDLGKIGQVIENLINNAIKYSEVDTPIRISGRRDGSWYQIDVEDRGIGMNTDELSHVFEKFYRAHSVMSAIGGLGLGMTIVKNIVEAHAGKIWLESEEGRGTIASFVLPLVDNDHSDR